MKRIHTLIVTLVCTAAFAITSFASLSYGAELPAAAGEEAFNSYDVSVTQTGPEVINLRAAGSGFCGDNGDNVSWTLDDSSETLTISGTGKMQDFPYDGSPWYNVSSFIKTVVIENGVTSIGNSAFFHCSKLQSITIPSGVTSIGNNAFDGCSSLQSITIPSGVTSIGDSAFEGCSGLQSITIPSGVTSIGDSAFEDCSGLQSITIPSGVTSIGSNAFYNCRSLQSVTIPSSVTSIGNSAFFYCSGLQRITILARVTSIESSTFLNCKKLESIAIPAGVTIIENNAFSNCINLKSIMIPSSVTRIGDIAFNGCSSLETVYYNGLESEWKDITIRDNNAPLEKPGIVHFNSIVATGVSLNKESLALTTGETAVLSAALIPEGAVMEDMVWSSADPGIAKVADNGTVTAVSEGETKVTAMSAAWGFTAECSVTVKKAENSGDNSDPSKRTKPANTFVGGQKVDVKSLYFSSHPEAARFQSSSKKTASVSKKGIMKAKKPGTVTIEAQTGKKKAERKTVSSCTLTILDRPKLKFKVKYSASTDIGKVLDGYEFFTTASTKQTAADLWESSKPAVAEVNPETGVITVKGKGIATITAYFGKKGEKGTLKVKAKLKVKK